MRLVWTPWAIPAIAVLVFAWAMAAFVFFARPGRAANRRLALQLFLEGFVVSGLAGVTWLIDDAAIVWAITGAATFLVWPKLWAYFNFLATLPTPLARVLHGTWRLRVFLALTLVAGLSWFLWPELYYVSVVPAPWAPWAAVPGPGFFFIMKMWAIMWLIGLAFSLSAVRHAPSDIARRQAKAYLLAFGTRDVLFAGVTIGLTLVPPTSPWFLPIFMLFPLIWVLYVPLVGYGILRTQLFDIDLKIKIGIERSTIVGAFAVAFWLGGELLERMIPVDGPILGLAAAGALALAFRPLQRGAERLADTVMPGVKQTPDYADARKHEVYRAAIEGALADGDVTDKERAMLRRLRETLGIGETDAGALESDARADYARGTPA